jgi:CspA family cold shock protein
METGTIVRLVPDRGFGFIRRSNGEEIFFHASGVEGVTPFDNLREGQQVTFEATRDDRGRGMRAVHVQAA